jgi:uncharacterized repeat protein (TIGR01451 family)/CSLREA domain-containing protein
MFAALVGTGASRRRTRRLRFLAITSLVFAVIASPQGSTASAASTITVTTTDDELNTDGDCSLREAIQAANTDTAVDACTAGSGADTIVVPGGTYTLAISGANEEANATGDLDVGADVTITGAGSGSAIVAGPAGWNDRIFDVGLLANGTATVSGLTVSGGNVDGPGGGIRENGNFLDLTLSDVALSGNTATGDGGGLFSSSLGSQVFTNVTATNNTAVGAGGGILTANASSTMMNLTLTDNESTGGTSGAAGGGAYISDQSATITGLTATGNRATLYGGLALFGGGGVLEDATISGNTADNIGGGLHVGDGWTIRRASISGNQSVGESGGIEAVGDAVIEDTTVDGNTALEPLVGTAVGGGIFGLGFTLERVAVTNNTATGFGGGVAVSCCLATHLTNVTISGNSGGGFAGGGRDTSAEFEVVVHNSTIANNSPYPSDPPACAPGSNRQCASAIDTLGGYVILENDIVTGPEPVCPPLTLSHPTNNIVSNGHNLSYPDPSNDCELDDPSDQVNTDPRLDLLASNDGPADDPPDGPTKTHALLPGSPAIDAGSDNCPATDQRGVTRPQGGTCDIGAFELEEELAGADLSLDKADSPDPVGFKKILTYTLTISNGGPNDATGVMVEDTLPVGVQYLSASPSQGTCAQAGGVVTCDLGTVVTGATVTIKVRPTSRGTLTNTAEVSASEPDPNPANNSDTETTQVPPSCPSKPCP